MAEKLKLTEKEWKEKLSEEEFYVLRKKGTERAFTGEFWNHFEDGTYLCAACEANLFDSESKFDAHCGWPSFGESTKKESITEVEDNSLGMKRIEVICSNCDSHLGHVFNDGPTQTGLRYCINSVSIKFEKEKKD